VAVGAEAQLECANRGAVAVGYQAGRLGQGEYAVALGYKAGAKCQHANSIVLNATGKEFTALDAGLYAAPIREKRTRRGVFFNQDTNEITEAVVNRVHTSSSPDIKFKYNKNVVNINQLGASEYITIAPDLKSQILEGDTIDVIVKVHRVAGCDTLVRFADATFQLFINSTNTVHVDECKNKIVFDTKVCKTFSLHFQLLKTECGYIVSLISNN
jgi:hypothetical protein